MRNAQLDVAFLIAADSDMYSRASFEYPSGVVVRPTGIFSQSSGLEYEGLEVVRGAIKTLDGKIGTNLRFRTRHEGETIHTGDSIVIDAEIDGAWLSVGWFGLVPVKG